MTRTFLIFGLVLLGHVTAAASDDEHWRFWILGRSDDVSTVTLYDRVADSYLHQSDYRVLREELDSVYLRLAGNIGSESDAQTAAMLIRLFHYSASRPYRTAVLCGRISKRLAQYRSMTTGGKASSAYEIIDSWVAVDVSITSGLTLEHEVAYRERPDYADIIPELEARWLSASSDTLQAIRWTVQAIDGVTSAVEYGGYRDTALCRQVYVQVQPLFDKIYRICRGNSVEGLKAFLARHLLLLEMRLADIAEPAQAESQALAYCIGINSLASQVRNSVSFPELRMRSNALRYLIANAASSIETQALFLGVADTTLTRILLLCDLAMPGTASIMLGKQIRTYMAGMSVRSKSFNSLIYQRIDTALSGRNGDLYMPDFDQFFKQGLLSLSEHHCDRSRLFLGDDIPYDRYYLYRLAVLQDLHGMNDEAVFNIHRLVGTSKGEYPDPIVLGMGIRWLLNKPLSLTCDTAQWRAYILRDLLPDSLFARLMLANTKQAQVLLSHRLPWMAVSQINSLRDENLSCQSRLDSYRSENTQASMNRTILLDNVKTRSGVTRYTRVRQKRVRLREDLQLAGERTKQRAAMKAMLRSSFENDSLAPYAYEKPISLSVLNKVGVLNIASAAYHRVHQYGVLDNAQEYSVRWEPDSETVYVILDRYRDLLQSNANSISSRQWPYRWHIAVVTNNQMFEKWDIYDSLMATSLSDQQRAMAYGANAITDLDSMLAEMLDLIDPNQQKERIVFLPADYMYAYNPYLMEHRDEMIADIYTVVVSASVGEHSHVRDLSSLVLLSPQPTNLQSVVGERAQIAKLMLRRNWYVDVVRSVGNESELADRMQGADAMHISSHALQSDLYAGIQRDSTKRELLYKDEVGIVGRRLWTSLLQYRPDVDKEGVMYGDGVLAPLEMEVYNIVAPRHVYLSTCQTIAFTSDVQEPPDGLIRELFAQGANCVVASSTPVNDTYAAEHAKRYYRKLAEGMSPEIITAQIVSEGRRRHENAQIYGSYYPIYFSVP